MKKFFATGIATLLLLAGSVSAAEEIVFVDLERVFNEFYKTQLAKSRMELQQKDIEAERKIMVDELTAISAEVDALRKEARDTALADEVRDSKRMLYEERLLELRAKQKELDEFVTRRTQQLQLQVNRMSQTIMDEIRQAIVDYAKKEGFKSVIDNSARRAAVGVFIYTHPDVEITATLLDLLNSRRAEDINVDSLFDEATPEEGKPEEKGTP
jgi:Skp family chaperone for outer membrane proteins